MRAGPISEVHEVTSNPGRNYASAGISGTIGLRAAVVTP
jgi:hypothetical protein